jgi:hypothetical protein
MKLNRFCPALAATLLTGVLSRVAQAHPGHGESGWVHPHSASVIALTVVYLIGFAALILLLHAAATGATTFSQKMMARLRVKRRQH